MQLNVTIEISDSLADKAKKIPDISSFVSRTFQEALRSETEENQEKLDDMVPDFFDDEADSEEEIQTILAAGNTSHSSHL